VGDDYDDDESFGFAQGFTDVTEQDDDEVDGYRSRTKKGGKSNLRRRERNTPADVNGIKDGLKVDANNKGELTMNNKGELTTKQLKELAKKEEETEKMLEMGVPKALLRKLESEKRAVDAFNVQKQKANSRRTHKRLTIVAGSLSKRKLLSPSGLDTRPMMGMVRGAAFDMIMSLIGSRSNTAFPPDSRWLDLFAGTGAIGIEAISRGCVESHFVEMDPWVVNNVTRKNLHSLGVNKQTTVHTAKVEQFLAQHKNTARAAGGAFDFVSFCPPYYRVSYPELLLELDQSPLIADHTVLLVEYARSQKPEILPAIGKRLRRVRDRRYGRTYVALYVCDGRELPDEDDEWADPVEEATKFGKAVRGGGKRDDDDI
jgi:16S rRNA (guanine(966)-N(2))-methyltransferase RsmD